MAEDWFSSGSRSLWVERFFSVINLSRIAVNYFLEVGQGHIVVTSSLAGKVGAPFSGTYTGSKHAIQGYFDSLRNEIRHLNIHVTVLCPGPTFSSLLRECTTEKPDKPLDGHMSTTDRRMTAERCAYLCCVAIANKLEESWQGIFPIMTLMYLYTYLPYPTSKAFGFFAKRNLFMKIRDSHDDNVKKDWKLIASSPHTSHYEIINKWVYYNFTSTSAETLFSTFYLWNSSYQTWRRWRRIISFCQKLFSKQNLWV